ncbi:MAG: cytochrome c oxidase subunit 3 [Crocinitomicaceae bacterium]|jgi:cytochrome c oxidase subunit 3
MTQENLTEENTNGPHYQDDNKIQMEKAKKNLIYVGMFSVLMLFAGFSSAYIVSMGDAFWLKVPFPSAFWVSTALILSSSIVLIFAMRFAKRNNMVGLKVTILTTFILGLGFVYFQFKGYGQLFDKGVHPSFNGIVVTDGRYGNYFEVKRGEDYVRVNGNEYLLNDKKMSDEQMKELQSFMLQFTDFKDDKPFKVKKYGEPFTLLFHEVELAIEGETLQTRDSTELPYLDRQRLYFLALNIRDGRGDFFVKGEMGKDFHVYYKGKELEYKNRQLHWKGAILSPYLQVKAMESSDTASSYLFLITITHLVHVLVTMFFMLAAVIRSFRGRVNSENTIGLNMSAIFWHFLGLLWVYLLLFLLFIH